MSDKPLPYVSVLPLSLSLRLMNPTDTERRTYGEKRASVATSLYSRRLAAVARPRHAARKATASSAAARRASAAATSSRAASSRGDGSASLCKTKKRLEGLDQGRGLALNVGLRWTLRLAC